jgi:hypothetical protein
MKNMDIPRSLSGFTITVYHRRSMPVDQQVKLLSGLFASKPETCRWTIDNVYFIDSFYTSDVIITVSHPNEIYQQEYGMHYVAAFAMFSYSSLDAFIHLVCAKRFSVSLRLGEFVLCLVHIYLRNVGVEHVYLDAADNELAEYYDRLGYEFGQEWCEDLDPITTEHREFRSIHPGNYRFWEQLPNGYLTRHGYRMKRCVYPEDMCAQNLIDTERRINQAIARGVDLFQVA